MNKSFAWVTTNRVVMGLCVVIAVMTFVLGYMLFVDSDSTDHIATKVLAKKQVRVPVTTPEGVPVTTPEGKTVYETKTIVVDKTQNGDAKSSDNKSTSTTQLQIGATSVTQTTKKNQEVTATTTPFKVMDVGVMNGGPANWSFDGNTLTISKTWSFGTAIYSTNDDAIGKSVQVSYTYRFQNGMKLGPKYLAAGQAAYATGSIDLGLEDCQPQWVYLEVKWPGGSIKSDPQNLVWPSTPNGYCNQGL